MYFLTATGLILNIRGGDFISQCCTSWKTVIGFVILHEIYYIPYLKLDIEGKCTIVSYSGKKGLRHLRGINPSESLSHKYGSIKILFWLHKKWDPFPPLKVCYGSIKNTTFTKCVLQIHIPRGIMDPIFPCLPLSPPPPTHTHMDQ